MMLARSAILLPSRQLRPVLSLSSRFGGGGGCMRTVTTFQETLMAQVPEKQADMARLKKEHGAHV